MTVTTQSQYDFPKNVYFATTDTSFVTGDSPVTLDVNNTLSRNGFEGIIINDGAGDFSFQISADGTNFGDSYRLKSGEAFSLKGLSIDSIKITWIADSAYRVFVA